jgi:hypothetical protein
MDPDCLRCKHAHDSHPEDDACVECDCPGYATPDNAPLPMTEGDPHAEDHVMNNPPPDGRDWE